MPHAVTYHLTQLDKAGRAFVDWLVRYWPMRNHATDEELVSRFVDSQEAADFAELYGRYKLKVYQSCIRYLEDAVEAQDQTQEVFCKVLKRLGGFRQEASFSTWLYSLTRNHCFTVRQQQAMRKHLPLDAIPESAHTPAPENSTLDERWQAAEKALSQLPARDEQMLRDRYLLGKAMAELADDQGISISAIKMRLKRARDQAQVIHRRLGE